MEMDHLARREVRKLEKKLEEQRRRDIKSRGSLASRLDYLESVLGHNLLMLHALIGRLIDQGVVSRDQLLEAARALDAADGVEDGEIDLNSTLPPEKRETTQTVHDLFRHLKRHGASGASPLEFLRQLEQKD